MATIQELKRQIENVNAIGIKNLADKGVSFAGFSPTTYEIMQGIADIIRDGGDDSGGGVQYTSIMFNDDDTIFLIDSEGNNHTMSYAYEDDKLKTITYDGVDVPVEYVEELLSKVGSTNIILAQSQVDRLYSHYGVDKATYNYVAICLRGTNLLITFANSYSTNKFGSQYNKRLFAMSELGDENNFPEDHSDISDVVDFVIGYMPKELIESTGHASSASSYIWWCNIQDDWLQNGTLYKMRENDISDIQNGFALGFASGGVVEVGDTGEIDAIEDLIDGSGVLEDTEGTVTEKVEELIDRAEELDVFQSVTTITFDKTTFPSKERVKINLPNVTNLDAKFSSWNTEPIPRVDELILTTPKAKSLGMLFYYCNSFKKVVLNLSNNITNMRYALGPSNSIEEVELNFSTENVTNFNNCFSSIGNIKTIYGTLDFSSATDVSYMFNSCANLEEVTFAPKTLSLSISLAQSSKLTSESVQSIVDGLATVETAQTLTLNKAIALTDEQKATINAKGWTLAQ